MAHHINNSSYTQDAVYSPLGNAAPLSLETIESGFWAGEIPPQSTIYLLNELGLFFDVQAVIGACLDQVEHDHLAQWIAAEGSPVSARAFALLDAAVHRLEPDYAEYLCALSAGGRR